MQQTKTQAWNAVHNVDSTLSEHAHIYSMACDAYLKLNNKASVKLAMPPLNKEDLYIATMILGSEITGLRNGQKSWIWDFGNITAVCTHGVWDSVCNEVCMRGYPL